MKKRQLCSILNRHQTQAIESILGPVFREVARALHEPARVALIVTHEPVRIASDQGAEFTIKIRMDYEDPDVCE